MWLWFLQLQVKAVNVNRLRFDQDGSQGIKMEIRDFWMMNAVSFVHKNHYFDKKWFIQGG